MTKRFLNAKRDPLGHITQKSKWPRGFQVQWKSSWSYSWSTVDCLYDQTLGHIRRKSKWPTLGHLDTSFQIHFSSTLFASHVLFLWFNRSALHQSLEETRLGSEKESALRRSGAISATLAETAHIWNEYEIVAWTKWLTSSNVMIY